MDNKFNISISTGTIVKAIAIILLLVFIYTVKDLFLGVLVAVVIASAVEPGIKWLKKYKVPRVPAVIIIYIAVALIMSGLFYFLLPPLVQEATAYLNEVPQYLDKVDVWAPLKSGITSGNQAVEQITKTLSLKEILVTFQNSLTNGAGSLLNTTSVLFGGIVSFLVIIVLSFYLAVTENGVADFLKVIVPLNSQKYIIDLWRRSQLKIGLWMEGQIILGIVIGVLVYLGLTIMGIKHSLLLAVFAGFFELIPVFCPILAAVPSIIVALIQGGFTTVLLVVGLYLIIQQFENQLIYPLVVKKIVGVSPIVVIIALLAGWQIGGFLGLLISVPGSAALMELYNDIQTHKHHEGERLGLNL